MEELYGLALSNWAIWVVMVVFIVSYFVVTEIISKREGE